MATKNLPRLTLVRNCKRATGFEARQEQLRRALFVQSQLRWNPSSAAVALRICK